MKGTIVIHNAAEVATPDATGLRVLRVRQGGVAVRDGRVVELGDGEALRERHVGAHLLDAGRRLVTPGLVDCHTHMIFAGHRAEEFQRRLAGQTYAAIAANGGGIRSTVRDTAAASDEVLEKTLVERLERWRTCGCTTVEVKSGYGLVPQAELRLLEIVVRAAERAHTRVVPTALLLHAIPEEWRDRRSRYVDEMSGVVATLAAHRWAGTIDAYCDDVAFTVDECRALLSRAQELGFGVKLHAEQLGRSGGAKLAAELGALSADHLECANEEDWRALAEGGVVGVLLPGAALTLGQRLPSAVLPRSAGARVAVATDFNPGTSPTESLPCCAALAARLCGFTAEESLLAVTWNAARALGRERELGHLTPGARGDVVVWECEALEELTYWLPAVRAAQVLVGGE